MGHVTHGVPSVTAILLHNYVTNVQLSVAQSPHHMCTEIGQKCHCQVLFIYLVFKTRTIYASNVRLPANFYHLSSRNGSVYWVQGWVLKFLLRHRLLVNIWRTFQKSAGSGHFQWDKDDNIGKPSIVRNFTNIDLFGLILRLRIVRFVCVATM